MTAKEYAERHVGRRVRISDGRRPPEFAGHNATVVGYGGMNDHVVVSFDGYGWGSGSQSDVTWLRSSIDGWFVCVDECTLLPVRRKKPAQSVGEVVRVSRSEEEDRDATPANLVNFIYLLFGEHLPAFVVEDVVNDAIRTSDVVDVPKGWLFSHATELADRLLGRKKG